YLRLFFTTGAAHYLKSSESRVNPLAILQWMVRVEEGRMVDTWSSLELKKLIYLTRRRIRYCYTKELDNSAVFFKSGSLFICKPEPNFKCGQYMGNDTNVLNSLAVVETPREGLPDSVYMVAVMSNELKRNASLDHASLAAEIHKLVLGQ